MRSDDLPTITEAGTFTELYERQTKRTPIVHLILQRDDDRGVVAIVCNGEDAALVRALTKGSRVEVTYGAKSRAWNGAYYTDAVATNVVVLEEAKAEEKPAEPPADPYDGSDVPF